jgi:hypothetical protein
LHELQAAARVAAVLGPGRETAIAGDFVAQTR